MAGLFSQLGGNPFNTQVGQRIEQATDGSLASENWALNIEICDMVNETAEGPKDALRAIRKRLLQNAGKNYTVVMYSLTVLESCVKNNKDKRFQFLVTQKDFVQDLIKLIGPKNDPPTAVQEKVLSLIQSWAEDFRGDPEMQGVVQIYTDLKQKGIEFPHSESDKRVPIQTPSRTIPPQPEAQEVQIQENLEPVSNIPPQQLEKLQKELDLVKGNMKVFSEMLTELTPGKEHQSDLELLWDLCKTCQNMQGRIVELLDKVGNEKITEDLLQVNDELNTLFLRYEKFEKKRALSKASLSPKVEEPKPLIDLDDNSADGLNTEVKNLDLNSAALDLDNACVDEFDMLAQNRASGLKKKTQEEIEIKPDQVTEAIKPQDFQIQREQDFHEMERWLQDQPEDLKEEVQAMANPEFDRFLAARAAAAEKLPTINSTSSTISSPSGEINDQKKSSPLKS